MRYNLNGGGAMARVDLPKPEVNINVSLPEEELPPGIEDWLSKNGWRGDYCQSLSTTLFTPRDANSPYAYGHYHWYEVVALEALNLMTLGNFKDAVEKPTSFGADSTASAGSSA